jgi:homoserine dehydrogenase
MRRVNLIQVGVGLIGGAVIEQIVENRARWRETLGLDVRFCAVAGKQGALVAPDEGGWGDDILKEAANREAGIKSLSGRSGFKLGDAREAIERAAAAGPTILIDVAAGSETAPLAAAALDEGAGAVFSNKAPFALPIGDPIGDKLWANAGPNGRVRYETTCGAGLPVISTLRSLLDTGDEPIEIMGALSGTLGAIFSNVAAGIPFSAAVHAAKAAGYTEPDPRDDLSGLDVARKALILARTIGRKVNLDEIEVESLVPASLAGLSVPDYLSRIKEQDKDIAGHAAAAKANAKTLKYVARVAPEGKIVVGPRAVDASTVLGALQGPENIVSFRTSRYDAYPLNIAGPGAGAAVTAAGVLADVLALALGPIGG